MNFYILFFAWPYFRLRGKSIKRKATRLSGFLWDFPNMSVFLRPGQKLAPLLAGLKQFAPFSRIKKLILGTLKMGSSDSMKLVML